MILYATDKDQRYECYLMQPEDVEDQVGIRMMVEARFLDFPYPISEGTRDSAVEIVESELNDETSAKFLIYDNQTQKIIAHGATFNLDSATPEISDLYVGKDTRGQGLVGILYDAMLSFLKNSGYTQVNVAILDTYKASFNAAIRNGFSLYSPVTQSDTRNNYHLRRGLTEFTPKYLPAPDPF